MNNYVQLVIGLLEQLGLLTETEATKLCKEVQYSTLPDNYEAARTFLKDIHTKLNISEVGSKLRRIDSLEKDIKALKGVVDELGTAIALHVTPKPSDINKVLGTPKKNVLTAKSK